MNQIAALKKLADAGVDFVIIGGWSAILHGSSYLTKEKDLRILPELEGLLELDQPE